MKQSLALEIMLEGESVLLTGQAGAGKTYVLNEFIRRAKKAGKTVAVTATTGLAATHLGGNTIHAWSGIGIHDELPRNFFKQLAKGRQETIRKTDVLIIDEISMLHDYRLDMIDAVARKVREKEDQPFGGLQVILCGDFFQLPPVTRGATESGRFVVHSNVWQELDPTICYLSEQFRQDDDNFLEILTAIREGDVRRRHAEALLARINAEVPGDQEITELHTTNIDVDGINKTALRQLSGDEFVYDMVTSGAQNYVETLKRSCLAPEELILKTGALVMCIKNAQDRKYVNGSLGIVTGFEEETLYPIVRLRNGKTITVRPDIWELRDGTKKRAALTQLPLRLAWAITIHKSQGMTLDAARIDLSKAFVAGMGYVALSRVKRLDSLSLMGINKKALQVSSDALAINSLLQEKALADAERFKHLTKRAEQAEKKTKAKKSQKATDPATGKTPWAERLAIMRQTHPNAFMPWSKTDDEKLLELFHAGVTLTKLSEAFGRHGGSIKARLKKHLGDDIKVAS